MDESRWLELVAKLDARARRDPDGYRRRVAAYAALGYLYIGVALALLLALAGGVVYLVIHHPGPLIKLIIPIAATGWVIVRSLAVRIEPPEGVPLDRADAPALFELLDDVNASVRGPKVDQVLLDGQLNAGIVQVARVGALFGSRNYLLVGLPPVAGVVARRVPRRARARARAPVAEPRPPRHLTLSRPRDLGAAARGTRGAAKLGDTPLPPVLRVVRPDLQRRFRRLGQQREQLLDAAAAERETYEETDEIVPAGLSDESGQELRRVLSRFPEVQRAYVVRKRVTHLADEYPHYVVCAVVEKLRPKAVEPSLASPLARAIELPGAFHVIVRRRRSDVVRRFESTAGDPVFSRS
jgi:hypothetical protein